VLLIIAVSVLLVARARLTPDTFGDTGHYRAAAIPFNVAKEIRYAGLPACAACHDDFAELKASSFHRGLTCEGCHGAAADHAEDPGEFSPEIPRGRDQCLRCHRYQRSRPTGFAQVLEGVHNPMQACNECHDPHDPTPPQVPGDCSACHRGIASTKAVSHHWQLDCETCHQTPVAHRENPRTALPTKPQQRSFCGGCHGLDADGEFDPPRVDLGDHGGRYVCWQCHYPHAPEGKS
jgi:hypothetical protein